MTPAIMIQGTGSNVGKSLIVAGLCRAFADRGLKVAPFKPQNMSNNAGVAEGGEIGRAQTLQARAARVAPSVHMNPVLLKPETDTRRAGDRAGQALGDAQRAATTAAGKPSFCRRFWRASQIVARARRPRARRRRRHRRPRSISARGDIANMGFAAAADVPVALVGDIDRGGVIAAMVGTHAVLDRRRSGPGLKAFIINKFRGDPSLFEEGRREIAKRTGWPSLGVVPHFADARRLPAEDVLGLVAAVQAKPAARIRIAVPRLPRIANFDDLDPLSRRTRCDG